MGILVRLITLGPSHFCALRLMMCSCPALLPGLSETLRPFNPVTRSLSYRIYFINQKATPYSLHSQFEKLGGLKAMSAWDNYSSVCMEWELSNESCTDEHKEVKNAGAQIMLHCLAPSLAFMGFCKLTVTFLGEVLIFPQTIDRKWFIFFLFSLPEKGNIQGSSLLICLCKQEQKKSPAYIEGRKVLLFGELHFQ